MVVGERHRPRHHVSRQHGGADYSAPHRTRHVTGARAQKGGLMNIADFLEQYVEGYLFEDLTSMEPIRAGQGKECGAVGYPMVAATLAGIELLGALTSAKTFDPIRGGRQYFRSFWE